MTPTFVQGGGNASGSTNVTSLAVSLTGVTVPRPRRLGHTLCCARRYRPFGRVPDLEKPGPSERRGVRTSCPSFATKRGTAAAVN